MQNHRAKQSTPNVKATCAQRVLVATTAMLAFISFWQAARRLDTLDHSRHVSPTDARERLRRKSEQCRKARV
jgi:hypothetical protein